MKDVLDRAVKDMDTAWDEARERWRAAKAERRSATADDVPAEEEEAAPAEAGEE